MKCTKSNYEKAIEYWKEKKELYEKMFKEVKEQLSTAKEMVNYLTEEKESINKH